MTIKTDQQLFSLEQALISHIMLKGITVEQANAIIALIPSLAPAKLTLVWSVNREGDRQTYYRGYYLSISESSPTIKVMHYRPSGGTIQWYNSTIDEAIRDIDEHIDDNMHVNTCQN